MTAARILVVEDEPQVATDIRLKLEETGYKIVGTCGSGEQAIALAERHRPDLILMDIVLEGAMDGIEAARRIQDRFPIPVVYLTAHADDARIEQAKVTDSFGYIVKPTTARELHAVITLAMYRAETTRKLQVAAWTSATLQSICDALITLDIHGQISALNPAAEVLLHVREDKARGRPLSEYAKLAERIDGATLSDLINAAGAAGKSFVCKKDAGFVLADGTYVPVHFSASPVQDPTGNILGTVLVAHEDTERRNAELELIASKRQLEAILDNTTAVIYIKDIDGRYLIANRQYERIIDFERGEIIGKTDFDLFPAEIADQLRANDSVVLQDCRPMVYEERIVQKDGPRDYVSVKVPLLDADERCNALCGISTDITEQRRRQHGYLVLDGAMQTLARHIAQDTVDEKAFYRDICAGIVELVEADIGAFPLLNESGTEFTYQDAVGTHADLLRGQSMPVQGGGLCGWVAEQGEPLCVPDLSRDERVLPELARALEVTAAVVVPVSRSDRVVGGLSAFRQGRAFDALDEELLILYGQHVAIAIDNLQLRKSLEQRVAERTAALSDSNAELESFSYSVSHDLRAPLRSIEGFSSALLEDYHAHLDEQGQDYLRRVCGAAVRMSHLIDDLLGLSNVTRATLRYSEVNLSDLAREVIDTLQVAEPERRIKVSIAQDLQTRGDVGLLRIVLENLFSNAWKFTRKQSDARVEFDVQKANGEIVYYVKDNGAGFDMAYVDKLFGAFQRLHDAKEYEGTGIGLATVQRAIRRHGGRIWAEAAPGHGTTLYFTLGV